MERIEVLTDWGIDDLKHSFQPPTYSAPAEEINLMGFIKSLKQVTVSILLTQVKYH